MYVASADFSEVTKTVFGPKKTLKPDFDYRNRVRTLKYANRQVTSQEAVHIYKSIQ